MKKNLTDILTCALFCGFMAVMLVLFLALPKSDFSQREKRALAAKPDTSADAILSGAFGDQAETYIADHIPGREFFVGMASYYDLFSGRQGTKDVLLAKGDRLVEKPNVSDDAAALRNMTAINRFAQTIGQPVDLMIIPSAGFAVQDQILGAHVEYTDDAIISDIYSLAGEGIRTIDMVSLVEGAADPAALYYRTDHHWTALGAYNAYSAYMQLVGREYPKAEEFAVESHGGFYGSTHSKAETTSIWKHAHY